MRDLVVIQPSYKGLEQAPFIGQSVISPRYLPLHVGSVEYVRSVWGRSGITEPKPLGYPKELIKYYNRRIIALKYYGHRNFISNDVFIKPLFPKQFESQVITGNYGVIKDANRDFVHEWFEQEVVEFDQEYRVYCIKDRIVGCGRYDSEDSPDLSNEEIFEFVESVIDDWKTNKPIAYAIDVGVIKGRGLAVVELSDAWALGLYKPCPHDAYAEMLKLRWDQIVKN